MDSSRSHERELEEHRLVFAYGPSIDLYMLRLLDIATTLSTGIVFCVVKNNSYARALYNIQVQSDGPSRIGLAVGDRQLHEAPEFNLNDDRLIFCSSGQMRNILVEQIRRHRTDMIGWVMIQSWDSYDVNAYAVANLTREHTNASVTLLSCSQWCPLPYDDSVIVQHVPEDYTTVYGKSVSELERQIDKPVVYYGPQGAVRIASAIHHKHFEFAPEGVEIVIDTLKDANSKPISKHTADLRSDTIRHGVVYRCSTQEYFDTLRNRDPIVPDSGLDEAVIYLMQAGYDPLVVLGPNHPSAEVQKLVTFISRAGIKNTDIDKIVSLRLGVASGIFYAKYVSMYRASVTNPERLTYIAGLIACLIERPPSVYAPLSNYNKFVGRNDIETLCNMWSSLLLSHTGDFWTWKTSKYINMWCRDNGFVFSQITKLVVNMKRVCLSMKGGQGLFDNIKTEELNMISEVFRQLQDVTTRQQKWNRRDILPAKHITQTADVLPILHHGKMLQIYIDSKREFTKLQIRAEDVSIFFDI